MQLNLFEFLQQKFPLLLLKLLEQCNLVISSVVIAIIIGIPLGILIYRQQRLKQFTLSFTSMVWTIPSLALLAFFIPFFGIGVVPAIIVLSIYAILPILRNTVAGLENVPKAVKEAATALGFTYVQQLRLVELPIAMPIIVAGIRMAVSISVGVATLAAFIGAGGLGDFINQGLALNDTRLLLLGAVPTAVLALTLDFIIGRIENFFNFTRSNKCKSCRRFGLIYLGTIVIILISCYGIYYKYFADRTNTVIVATKNFTESILLGNLVADLITTKTHLQVITKFDLGTTAICQAAMVSGDIDIYPEYTGTAYLTVLNFNKMQSPQQIYDVVKQQYQQRFGIIWLPPLGFNNTQALAVREDFAKKFKLENLSDLKAIEQQLIIGAPAEFLERPDGYIGLQRVYGLNFKAVKQMDPGLIYKAIQQGDINIMMAFSTDGRITAYHLQLLHDDKNLYLAYNAAILIREQILKKHPQIADALSPLFGNLNDKTMQQLNYAVDVLHESPDTVARQFLRARKMI